MKITTDDLAPCVSGWQSTIDRSSLKDGDCLLVARLEIFDQREWIEYETIKVMDWGNTVDAEQDDEFEDGIRFIKDGDDWNHDLENVIGWVKL